MDKKLKAPIILVLISTLVSAPLFADTLLTKSAETYSGEMVTTHGESEHNQPEGIRKAMTEAEAAAEVEANKSLWFAAGCLVNFIAVIIADVATPSVPEARLVGKSPEYVRAFTHVYARKVKSIRVRQSTRGCIVSSCVIGGCISAIKGLEGMDYAFPGSP